MKQVDDGRPGMAFELGVNIFADGNPVLNVCTSLKIDEGIYRPLGPWTSRT